MTKIFIAAACAATLALSGCGTLGGGLSLSGGNAAAAQQFTDTLDKFNAAVSKNCTGGGDLSWSPPLPPIGSMHAHCEFGSPTTISPAMLAALAAGGFVPAAPAPAPILPTPK